jgi:hypothetical protein
MIQKNTVKCLNPLDTQKLAGIGYKLNDTLKVTK